MANDNIQWTSEQMIENASSWSLAGDVALLNRLKTFSEGLLSDTESLNAKVDNLLNSLDNVGLKLELTKNEFQSLRNTQFIENRVYEDDETLENDVNKVEEKEPTDEDKENAIKKSISKGLEVIKKYYDRVELAVSDSEGEGNENSYVLQPKDPYIDRPLPYLVGTQDWYRKWHVGLLPSESESESEKEEEVYSSGSDSEKHLPKNRNVGSETSSELDFINRNTGPIANSTFNDSQDPGKEVFHSSDESSEQSGSLPVKTPISNEKFAQQLAAKLGAISGKSEPTKDVLKPTGKTTQNPKRGNLFSDEPPPLEDHDDTVLPKSVQEGPFSNGKDLFSESRENDLFWNPEKEKSGISNVQKPSGQSNTTFKPKVPKGLFDNSDSSSEEDMLSVTEKRKILSSAVANPYMHPYKPTMPFVDDQPPDITPKNENETPKKKPIGGVSVLGPNANIFAGKSSNEEQSHGIKENPSPKKSIKKSGLFDESSDDEMFIPKAKTTQSKPIEKPEESKKRSLFDDSDDFKFEVSGETIKAKGLFDDDDDVLDAPKETKKMGLFDEDTYQNENIFIPTNKEIVDEAKHLKKEKPKKSSKKISLFDDDDDFYKEEEDIFATIPKEEKPKVSNKGLFDDLDDSTPSSNDVRPKQPINKLFDDNLDSSIDVKSEKKYEQDIIQKQTKSLFEDLQNEEELFHVSEPSIAGNIENKIGPSIVAKASSEVTVKAENDITQQVSEEKKDDANLVRKEAENTSGSDQDKSVVTELISSVVEDQRDNFVISDKPPEDKTRKNISLFDSDNENSSGEDMFGKDNKKIEQNIPDIAAPSNISRQSESEDIFKTTEPKRSANESDSVSGPQQNLVVPPPISLFDPTPPPVDWDATSDQSADSDTFSLTDGILERTNYNNQTQATSSSLFDEAPPSLDMNYSSGIVRDINITRVETDDSSSFYPHACSSRRLSSDIFNDQQSQDSFFVTKNSAENQAQASNLKIISENVEDSTSKIENLTPSGNPADFEETSSVFEESGKDSSGDMYTTRPIPPKKPETQKRVSLFSDQNEEKKGEDLHKKDDIKTSPGKLRHNLNINVGALLPGAALPRTRPTIVKSTSLDETGESLVRPTLQPTSDVARSKSEIFDSKKLITEPSQSGNLGNLNETKVLHSVTKDRPKIPIKRRPSTRKARQEAVRRSMTDFSLYQNAEESIVHEEVSPEQDVDDNLLDNSNEILKKPEEEIYEKLPEIKGISLVFEDEKPEKYDFHTDLFEAQSNISEAKLESLDETIGVDENKPDTLQTKSPFEDSFEHIFKTHTSVLPSVGEKTISQKSEAKDIFQSSPEDSRTPISSEPQKKHDLFGEEGCPNDSDEDLFSNASKKDPAPVLSKPKETQKPSLFFDKSDSDSDGDLFGSKSGQIEAQKPADASRKTNIFGDADESSEEDLFGSKMKSSSAGPSDIKGFAVGTKRAEIKTATVKKLENKEVTDFDPLSGFK